MDVFFQELINWIIVFGGVIGILAFGLNFLTKGFLFQYLRVKAGRGKFILTRIYSVTDTYYRPGKFEDGFYKVKTRSKEDLTIPLGDASQSSYVTDELGVKLIGVDEEGKKFCNYDMKQVIYMDKFDPGRITSLLLRIKNRPTPGLKKNIVTLIIIAAIIIAIVSIYNAYQIMTIQEMLVNLGKISGNI